MCVCVVVCGSGYLGKILQNHRHGHTVAAVRQGRHFQRLAELLAHGQQQSFLGSRGARARLDLAGKDGVALSEGLAGRPGVGTGQAGAAQPQQQLGGSQARRGRGLQRQAVVVPGKEVVPKPLLRLRR